MKREFGIWERTECDNCRVDFQVTRAYPKVVEDGECVRCEGCEMYRRGCEDGLAVGEKRDKQCQATLAAIQYALDNTPSDGMAFLRLWYDGEFPEIREWFQDAPPEVFIGVDPLYEDK